MEAKVTKEEMKSAVKYTLALQRQALQEGVAMVFGLTFLETAKGRSPDGPEEAETIGLTIFEPSVMSHWRLKSMLLMQMLQTLVQEKGTMFTICSDVWRGAPVSKEQYESLPSSIAEWPKELRRESLVCWVNAPGHRGLCASVDYTRDGDGHPQFEENITWLDELGLRDSRFSLDMTKDLPEIFDEITNKQQTINPPDNPSQT